MTTPSTSPAVDAYTQPFWDALNEQRLVIQRCNRCSRYQYYPRLVCRHCQARALTWEEVSGTGTIYTFSIVSRSPSQFQSLVPYVVAVVELKEGPRIATRIMTTDVSTVRIQDNVEVRFLRAENGQVLPLFEVVAPP